MAADSSSALAALTAARDVIDAQIAALDKTPSDEVDPEDNDDYDSATTSRGGGKKKRASSAKPKPKKPVAKKAPSKK